MSKHEAETSNTQNQNNNLWIHKVLSHVKFEPTTMGELGIDVATA